VTNLCVDYTTVCTASDVPIRHIGTVTTMREGSEQTIKMILQFLILNKKTAKQQI